MTKGTIRVAHQGVQLKYIDKKRMYNIHGDIEIVEEEKIINSNAKIDKLRQQTLDKVMKKLNKKNIIITNMDTDDTYTIIHYEVY